jgi:hypothetical protein
LGDHEVVDPTGVLTKMRDSAALWSVGYGTAAEVVEAACDLLVAGYDGPALRMLAAVSPRHADEDVPELLEAALRDVDLTHYEKDSRAGQEAAVRALATRVLVGSMSPMGLAVWAHGRFGHGTLGLAERLVELDDAYDSVGYTEMTEHDVNTEVVAEARRIVG